MRQPLVHHGHCTLLLSLSLQVACLLLLLIDGCIECFYLNFESFHLHVPVRCGTLDDAQLLILCSLLFLCAEPRQAYLLKALLRFLTVLNEGKVQLLQFREYIQQLLRVSEIYLRRGAGE